MQIADPVDQIGLPSEQESRVQSRRHPRIELLRTIDMIPYGHDHTSCGPPAGIILAGTAFLDADAPVYQYKHIMVTSR